MKKNFVALMLALSCLITFSCGGGSGNKPPSATLPAENATETIEPSDTDETADEATGETENGENSVKRDGESKDENLVPTLFFNATADGNGYEVSGITVGSYSLVEIPDTLEGLPVTEIKADAFISAKIVKAIIPASVVKIGERAFDKTNLEFAEFKNKDGWIAGDRNVPTETLENEKSAAIYLKKTFSKYEWKRVDYENDG